MPEARLDLSKISFEDVLNPGKTPLPGKKEDEIAIPDKPEDALEVVPLPKETPKEEPKPEGEEGNFYQDLAKLMGYEVEGEFDESVEGVAEYTKAVANTIAQEEIRDLFESFPDVKEYLQFRLNNGDPAKYFESKYGDVDYSKVTVDEKDELGQETVVRRYLSGQNYSDEEINEAIKDYKDTNLLFKTAKVLASKLVESQRARREYTITKQAEDARQAEIERESMVAEISDTIEKGSLHNLMIPEKDRKEFRAWLLQPDARGQTKRQETMKKLTLQQKLELEYMAYKGFNLSDLVKKEATQTKIDFLKKSTAPKGSRLAGGKEAVIKKGNSALSEMKITDIF